MSQTFQDLNLHSKLLANLAAGGYHEPTEIQQRAIPTVLAGRDVLARAETGAGKTAAMMLPVLQQLLVSNGKKSRAPVLSEVAEWGARGPRVLVLEPTHELAEQIGQETDLLAQGTRLRSFVVHAGSGTEGQAKRLRKPLDVLIATPGRLLDHLLTWDVDLSRVRHLVIDEADRMCDMGFLPDVQRIVLQTSSSRQTLFCSATLPQHVKHLAEDLLRDPELIEIGAHAHAPETIKLELYRVEEQRKLDQLLLLLKERRMTRALVFMRTRKRAERFQQALSKAGHSCMVLHGDKSPGMRRQALERLKAGEVHIVVSTDLGARGLHIEDLTHVVNVDVPLNPEQFIHRVGRTGRMGARGDAITFCSPEEESAWDKIQRRYRIDCTVRQG